MNLRDRLADFVSGGALQRAEDRSSDAYHEWLHSRDITELCEILAKRDAKIAELEAEIEAMQRERRYVLDWRIRNQRDEINRLRRATPPTEPARGEG